MGELEKYKRRVMTAGDMPAVHLAPPVTGPLQALDQLSNKMADLAVAYQGKLDKAEYDKYEAEFGTAVLERSLRFKQLKGHSVIGDPSAPTGNPPIEDMTKSLFDREKADLADQRESFVNKGSNERVRTALGAMWDQGSVQYLTNVANHQVEQMAVYTKQAQAANVATHQATFLAAPEMDKDSILRLNSDLLAANDGDTIKTRQEVAATVIEQSKQMARRDYGGFRQWVTDNESMLDTVAPGVVSEMQTVGREAWKQQREERVAQQADEAYERSERERQASEWAINMSWDTMMGKKGTSSAGTMRAIRDSADISPTMKQQLLSQMQSWRSKPVITSPSKHLAHNQDATLGKLDQDKLYNDVGKGLVSIEDARSLITFNRKQQDELDEPAKEHFKRAQQFFKDRFTINNAMGFAMFKTDKDKIQNNIAVTMLSKLWNETEPGKRAEIFRMEENKNGVLYMPVIQNIYEQAVRAPVEGFTTTGIKAKNANMSAAEANEAIDKALGK